MSSPFLVALALNPSIGRALTGVLGSLALVISANTIASGFKEGANITANGFKEAATTMAAGLRDIGTAEGSGMYHMERGLQAGGTAIAEAIKSANLGAKGRERVREVTMSR